MSTPTFPAPTSFSQNPNFKPQTSTTTDYNNTADHHHHHPAEFEFDLSSLFLAAVSHDHCLGEELFSSTSILPSLSQTQDYPHHQNLISSCNTIICAPDDHAARPTCSGVKRRKMEKGNRRIAFRTRTGIEVMDDGFKWKKYGKKIIKNNHNPRNYYKCSSEGCNVKKRIERDREDSSYVITTYEGKHNHQTPSALYYKETINYPSTGRILQPCSSLSYMKMN